MPTTASITLRRLAAALVVVATAASCTGGDDDTAPSTTVMPTTTTIPPRVSDGVLRVGAYLPLTGPGAALGPPMIEALNEAVDAINDVGGVLGEEVVLIQVDEGAGTIDDLLADDVDAIIGPASSTLAMSELDSAVDPNTGVVTCSPMATSAALDDYPDFDFFFRTAPSDSLQMVTIAREAERTGAQSIAVGYLDDPYGRGLEEAFVEAIDPRLTLTTVGFGADQDDLTSVAEQLLEGDPAAVVVLGDADDGSRLLAALDQATDQTDGQPYDVLVNDSLRQARSVIQSLSPAFRTRLTGYAPLARSMAEDGPQGFFVAHAVDCLNLIALAVINAGTDNPSTFRAQMSSVSSGGRACSTFESCANSIREGFGIDYNGLSGPVNLSGVTGDPIRAIFESFTFDEDGNEISAGLHDTAA